MKLLMHVCCGPCFMMPYEILRKEHEITALFYNPNIHPKEEYEKRLDVAKGFCYKNKIELIVAEYDQNDYLSAISTDKTKPSRCRDCFKLRLGMTAGLAKKLDLQAFSTSLLVSPYQLHDELTLIGMETAKDFDINFLYQDFRPHYSESVKRSRQQGMYRQNYCGCIFSLEEREEEKREKSGDLPDRSGD